MKKSKPQIFKWSLDKIDREAPEAIKQILSSGRGWKGRLVDASILMFGSVMKAKGKNTFTASAPKVHRDLKKYTVPLGFTISLRTIERRIAFLKKECLLVVEEGFCYINKQTRKVVAMASTVYALKEKGIQKVSALIKKVVNKIEKKIEKIWHESGFIVLSDKMAEIKRRTLEASRLAQEEYLARTLNGAR